MTKTLRLDDDSDLLAAELVLGLLGPQETLDARARMGSDEAFADRVAWWEARLAPLLDELGGVEPGDDLTERILALAGETQRRGDNGAEIIALRVRERRWRWTASITSVAAAVAIAFLTVPGLVRTPSTPPDSPATAAPLMASMPIEGTQLRLGVTYIPGSHDLLMSADGMSADGVHDHELWLVPAGGDVQSLGVVRPGEQMRVAVPQAVADNIADGAQLLLTREPLGGKPPDREPGPVVAEGAFSAT